MIWCETCTSACRWNRLQLFLSTILSSATWASRVAGGHQASSPQAGLKEHQSALWFTSQMFDRNPNFWLSHTKSPDHGFSSDLSFLGLWCFLPCWFVSTEPQAWAPFQRYLSQLVPFGHSLSISSASRIIRAVTLAYVSTPYWLLAMVFFAKFQCQTCGWSQSPWLSDTISHPFLFQPLQAS